jgi:hypothetical protein
MLAAFAAVISIGRLAAAQDDRETRALALFHEGRALLEKGYCPAAIPKFLEAIRLRESIGAHLSAAECYEHDDPAASWRQYKTAERQALELTDDRESFARSHAAALEPGLDIVQVRVVDAPPGLAVVVDQKLVVDAKDWKVALVPGDHTLLATAPNKKPWSRTLTASVGREDVRITLVDAAPSGAAVPLEAPAVPVVAPRPPEPEPQTPALGPRPLRRRIGLGFGAAGIAGLALGSIAGILAVTTKSDLRTQCGMFGGSYPSNCGGPTEASNTAWRNDRTSEVSTLRTWATVSTVGFIAGAALLGTGATLYLTGRGDAQPAVGLGLWPGGASAIGHW